MAHLRLPNYVNLISRNFIIVLIPVPSPQGPSLILHLLAIWTTMRRIPRIKVTDNSYRQFQLILLNSFQEESIMNCVRMSIMVNSSVQTIWYENEMLPICNFPFGHGNPLNCLSIIQQTLRIKCSVTENGISYLKDPMTEATLSVCTVIRLMVPAKLAGRRTRCEVFCTEATHVFVWSSWWFRAVSWLISMFNGHVLSIPSIPYCDVNGSTPIQGIIIYSVWSLISMYLRLHQQHCIQD